MNTESKAIHLSAGDMIAAEMESGPVKIVDIDGSIRKALEDWFLPAHVEPVIAEMTVVSTDEHFRGRYIHRHKGKRPKRGWQGKHCHAIKHEYIKEILHFRDVHVSDFVITEKSDGKVDMSLAFAADRVTKTKETIRKPN